MLVLRACTYKGPDDVSKRADATEVAVKRMKNHAVWDSGFRLSSLSASLKPELVTKQSDPQIALALHSAFGFDATLGVAPTKSVTAMRVCKLIHGGLCCNDMMCRKADLGSKNMYCTLMQFELKAPPIPLSRLIAVGPNYQVSQQIDFGANH